MTRRRAADTAHQDLTVGLHAVTEINQTIRYADTKAAALAAVQALAVTVLATRRSGPAGLAPDLLFGLCLTAVAISTALLALGLTPRLTSGSAAEGPNRVAFPSLARMARAEMLTTPTMEAQQQAVWRQAADLAAIAVAKYRWLSRATISTFGTLAAVLIWLGVTSLSR